LVTSALYTTWNAKESPLTFTSPLVRTVNDVACPTCAVGTVSNLATPTTIALRDGSGGLVAGIFWGKQAVLADSGVDQTTLLIERGTDSAPSANIAQVNTAAGATLNYIDANGIWNKSRLPADPSPCPGGQFATDQDASGVLTCSTPAGGGNVSGPGTSTTGFVPTYADTTGTLLATGYAASASAIAGAIAVRDGSGVLAGNISGQSGTSLALAADPTGCTSQFVRDIAAAGTLTCNTVALGADVSGLLATANGGFGASVAAATGFPYFASGALSFVAGLVTECVRGNGTLGTCGAGGGGDVVGPAGANADYVVLFDGTTGKLIKNGYAFSNTSFPDTFAIRTAAGNLKGNDLLADNALSVGAGSLGDATRITVTRGTDSSPTAPLVAFNSNAGSLLASITANAVWNGGVTDKGTNGGAVFNVKAYGAVGNGSSNDTSAFDSAVTAACAAGSGTIFFPPGTYATTTGFIVGNGSPSTNSTCNNVAVECAEGATLKWTGSSPSSITPILKFSGPMFGGGVRGCIIDANSVQGVQAVMWQNATNHINSHVVARNINRAHAYETNNLNPSGTYGSCYMHFQDMRNESTSTGASGWLMDGSAVAGSCSAKVYGGEIKFDGSSIDSVQYIRITNVGTCSSAPSVTISGGSGSGATATAYVTSGVLYGVRVTKQGSGYTSDPSVSFGAGCSVTPTAVAQRTPRAVRMGQADNNLFQQNHFSWGSGSTHAAIELNASWHNSQYGAYPAFNTFDHSVPNGGVVTNGTIANTNSVTNIHFGEFACDDFGCLSNTSTMFYSGQAGTISTSNTYARAFVSSTSEPAISMLHHNYVGGSGSTRTGASCFSTTTGLYTTSILACLGGVTGLGGIGGGSGPTDGDHLALYTNTGGGLSKSYKFYVGSYGIAQIGINFSTLSSSTVANGTLTYCTDCLVNSVPCSGSSTGAFAKRLNGAWRCD
jgi:hypothetical protein